MQFDFEKSDFFHHLDSSAFQLWSGIVPFSKPPAMTIISSTSSVFLTLLLYLFYAHISYFLPFPKEYY